MFIRMSFSRLFLFALILVFVPLANAQDYSVDTRPPRGFMPTADQLASPIDSIDTVSGKLNLRIPLASIPSGRGGIGFDLNLQYDSHIYDAAPAVATMWNEQDQRYDDVPLKIVTPTTATGGWTYNANNYKVESEFQETVGCQFGGGRRLTRMRVALPDGSMHILYLRGYENYGGYTLTNGFTAISPQGKDTTCSYQTPPQIVTGWLTYYTRDGSFLKVEVYADGTSSYNKDWYLYYPDGRRVVFLPGSGVIYAYDANNNWIHFVNVCRDWPDCSYGSTLIQDAGGREIQVDYNVTDADKDTDLWIRDQVTGPGPNGAITTTIDWQALEVGADGRRYAYAPGAPPPNDTTMPFGARFWVVKYIQLPLAPPVTLGQEPFVWNSYKFGYADNQNNGLGTVDYMRMPSGSEYVYRYVLDSQYPMSYCLSSWQADCIANDNAVSRKKIFHDGLPYDEVTDPETDLQWAFQYTATSTTVTAPDGGQTVSRFPAKNFAANWDSGFVNRIEGPIGSVRTRQWAHDGRNPYVAREAETVGNSSGSPAKTAVIEYTYDKNGNLLTKTEHDWTNYPNETGGTIKRKTWFDYYVTLSQPDDVNGYWRPHNTALWPTPQSARRLNAVRRRKISSDADGLLAYAATEYGYDNAYTSGNVTSEFRWDSVKSAGLPGLGQLSASNSQALSRSYDSYGNLTDIYAPEVRTHIVYNEPASNLVTDVYQGYQTSSVRHWHYDWLNNGAALWKKTDSDNGLVTTYSYDNVGRQLTMDEANLRLTVTSYDDANRKVTVTSDLRSRTDGKLQTITHHDQLGRVTLVQKSDGTPLNGIDDGIKVKTAYIQPFSPSRSGRRVVTSTPYRTTADSTLEWTCTQYDLLNRVTAVAMFNGGTAPSDCSSGSPTGVTSTGYDADIATVTDPAQKIRRQRRDGLGRILEVVEDPSVLNYSTAYSYDPLDNLIQVTQGSQYRYFGYSSLGRMTSATNPESGTTTCTYYDSGDLRRRTDARSVWSESTYDPLRRILTKTYSDSTPPVTYEYYLAGSSSAPNIGQLKSVTSSASTMNYGGYDAFGNAISNTQTTGGNAYAFGPYQWYLSGELKSIQYPSGRVINYDLDDAGRTNKAYATGKTYADMTGITNPYAPDGRISKLRLGNNLWETRDYHTPGTPTVYKLGTAQDVGNKLQLEYSFPASNNNGNLSSQTIVRPGYTWLQSYTQYDGVNRLVAASEGGGFSRIYGYDRYGNRWVESSTGLQHTDSLEPTSQTNFNSSNNRLTMTGISYDAAGNQTSYGGYTLGYDAENRNTTVSGGSSGSFAYDGDGRRVKKTWTTGGTTITTYYVYDALGRLAAEYSNQSAISTGTTWMFTDMLGSVRAITSESQAIVECNDYLPFGRMLSASDNGRSGLSCFQSDPDNQIVSRTAQKFTGKERDAETGLDYFGARYLSAAQGRFLSADPSSNLSFRVS